VALGGPASRLAREREGERGREREGERLVCQDELNWTEKVTVVAQVSQVQASKPLRSIQIEIRPAMRGLVYTIDTFHPAQLLTRGTRFYFN